MVWNIRTSGSQRLKSNLLLVFGEALGAHPSCFDPENHGHAPWSLYDVGKVSESCTLVRCNTPRYD